MQTVIFLYFGVKMTGFLERFEESPAAPSEKRKKGQLDRCLPLGRKLRRPSLTAAAMYRFERSTELYFCALSFK